ncbi:hypothetical protein T11_5304 [Trichinella zimbabwensis]|uniref:Uncharacterized protein n=1 Tax=Trichinella zimbabwensis TaxID=268475 RepID=A0A0V1GWW1_9BILA|nr:hypothetical protein T11_5304 [Trichinella zimbabwensis]
MFYCGAILFYHAPRPLLCGGLFSIAEQYNFNVHRVHYSAQSTGLISIAQQFSFIMHRDYYSAELFLLYCGSLMQHSTNGCPALYVVLFGPDICTFCATK